MLELLVKTLPIHLLHLKQNQSDAALLSTLAAVASMLELTVKTLPGEHARPLQQDLNRISPGMLGPS